MTQLRNHRWIYALICLSFVVCFAGCHGNLSDLAILWGFLGSWSGESATLSSEGQLLILAFITLALTACESAQTDETPTSGAAMFNSEVDTDGDGQYDDNIFFEGNFTRDGEDIIVNVSPQAAAQVGMDSISLDLQMGATEDDGLSGTIDYVRDGTSYSGNISFERFEDH